MPHEDVCCRFIERHAHREDWANPRLAPLLQKDFRSLPPALFIVAEIDPLRDDSYGESKLLSHCVFPLSNLSEYAKKLTAAGVHNELLLSKGAVHGFYTLPSMHSNLVSCTLLSTFCLAAFFKELTTEAYAKTIDFIKRFGRAD
jgi:acetyl esterase